MQYIDFTSAPTPPAGTVPGFYCHITQYGGGNLFDKTPADFAALGARIANGQPTINGGRVVSRNAVIAFDFEFSPDDAKLAKLIGFVSGFRSTNQTNPIVLYGLAPVVTGIAFNADSLIVPKNRAKFDAAYQQLWPLLRMVDYYAAAGELERFHRYRPEENAGWVKRLMVVKEDVCRCRRLFPWLKPIVWTRPWVGDDLMHPDEFAFWLTSIETAIGKDIDGIGIWGGGDAAQSAKTVQAAIAINSNQTI